MLAQYWPEFLSLAIVHFLAVILPGPDFAITVRQSMRYGHVIGCLTALGIGLGISVHVLYTLIGIGLFIQKHEWLMFGFKIAGAAYLCYLGWTLLKSQGSAQPAMWEEDIMPKDSISKFKALSTGFMTNALNPKATCFFSCNFYQFGQCTNPIKNSNFLWCLDVYGQCSMVHIGQFAFFSKQDSSGIFKERIFD